MTAATSSADRDTALESDVSHHGKQFLEKNKARKKRCLLINLTHCRYDSVRRVARQCGLQPSSGDNDDWTVFWMDTSVMMERVIMMKRYQVCHISLSLLMVVLSCAEN